MQHLACPRRGVTGLTFSPDGDMLVGTGDQVLWCWTRSRNWERTGIRHPGLFAGVAFHPGGRTLAYSAHPTSIFRSPGAASPGAEQFNGVRLYPLTAAGEFDPGVLLFQEGGDEFEAFTRNVRAKGLAFTPDGGTLLSRVDEARGFFSRARAVFLHWHFTLSGDRWRAVAPVAGRTAAENGAALVGANCLALAAKEGTHVCPLDPAAEAPLLAPDVSQLHPVASSPVGELVAGSDDQRVYVWHLREARPVASWPIQPRTVLALAFSPDGRTLAVGSWDRSVALRDPRTGGRVSSFNFGVGSVQSLAYAPDGLTLAVGGDRGLVVVDVG